MEVLRYALVFFVVGWGGGLIGGVFFIVTLPFHSPLRGTNAGRVFNALLNGTAVFLSVVLAALVRRWTGGQPKSAMFAFACVAMLLNDRWRINRVQTASVFASEDLDSDESMRANLVLTERLNMVADVAGFAMALWLLPAMALL